MNSNHGVCEEELLIIDGTKNIALLGSRSLGQRSTLLLLICLKISEPKVGLSSHQINIPSESDGDFETVESLLKKFMADNTALPLTTCFEEPRGGQGQKSRGH